MRDAVSATRKHYMAIRGSVDPLRIDPSAWADLVRTIHGFDALLVLSGSTASRVSFM